MEAKLPSSFVLLLRCSAKGSRMDFGPSGPQHRDYREVVTKEDAAKYFSILVSNQHLSPLLGDMKKPTSPRKSETTSPIAKKSKPVKKVKSAKSTPAENFTKLIELRKTMGPVPFRPTQQDYKRQEKLTSFLYWFDRPPQSSYT